MVIELKATKDGTKVSYGPGEEEESRRIEAFLTMKAGPNDERGVKKFCPRCNDYTGHIALPGTDWYLERCLRCKAPAAIRMWRVVHPRLSPFGKAVLMPPGMDERAILRMVIGVVGPEYFARCFELWFRAKVRARAREFLQESQLRLMEAKLE